MCDYIANEGVCYTKGEAPCDRLVSERGCIAANNTCEWFGDINFCGERGVDPVSVKASAKASCGSLLLNASCVPSC